MKIIGLSGTNGSGKDTVGQMLGEKHGFFVASATEMLGEELKKHGLPTDRKNKRDLSAQWRRESGLGVIVQRAVDEAKQAGYNKVAIGSLRNSGEADLVHQLGGKLVWVDADPKIRYERIRSGSRGRVEDERTFEEFLADEQVEMQHSGDEATLNVAAVKERADIFIENNGSLAEFCKKLEESLQEYI
jgi:dephospho-CoA kinase